RHRRSLVLIGVDRDLGDAGDGRNRSVGHGTRGGRHGRGHGRPIQVVGGTRASAPPGTMVRQFLPDGKRSMVVKVGGCQRRRSPRLGGGLMFTGLSREICENAWAMIEPGLTRGADLGLLNGYEGSLVVLDPAAGDGSILFTAHPGG